jgi:cysteinyl-tRNA synthetase
VKGEVIRYALLSTKYNEPLDWNDKLAEDAKKSLDTCYRILSSADLKHGEQLNKESALTSDNDCLECLKEDLNAPKLFGTLHVIMANVKFGYIKLDHAAFLLSKYMNLLGLLKMSPNEWFKGSEEIGDDVQSLIDARIAAKKAKNWPEADRIRNELKSKGILLEDKPDGTTDWRRE